METTLCNSNPELYFGINQYDNDLNPLAHYLTLGPEIWEQHYLTRGPEIWEQHYLTLGPEIWEQARFRQIHV
eukprot:1334221-Amorphochlora_amoeboformis.AAC.1